MRHLRYQVHEHDICLALGRTFVTHDMLRATVAARIVRSRQDVPDNFDEQLTLKLHEMRSNAMVEEAVDPLFNKIRLTEGGAAIKTALRAQSPQLV